MSMERVLEAHTEQDAENFRLLREELAELKAELVAVRQDMSEVKETLVRSKGFIGGVVFVVTALFALVGAAISYWK